MKKVYVEDDDYGIQKMFEGLGWSVVPIVRADIVAFSGGSDVSPHLYGEKNVASGCNEKRDEECMDIFKRTSFYEKPMIGICRGAQFLHVANGSKMWQDVNRHAIGGTHEATDDDGTVHLVTSTHHQMMRLPEALNEDGYPIWDTQNPDKVIVTTAYRASWKHGAVDSENALTEDGCSADVEVMWYPKTRSLCYQPHPEYGVKSCLDHFVKLLERFDLR